MRKTKMRAAIALAALCSFGSVGAIAAIDAPTAGATGEYFYYQNWLGEGGEVTGTPRGSVYFVGAYTSNTNTAYCVALSFPPYGYHAYENCQSYATSVTTSFPAQSGKGSLRRIDHNGIGAVRYIAEQRY